MEIVFKAKRKIKPIRTHARKQIGDGIKPLRPLEVYEPTLQPLSLKVFDIVKPLQMEIDKIEQKYKRKLQFKENKRTDVGLSRFTQILGIPRIKSYPKIVALLKKAKALDKAIQTLNKAIQRPSKHR